MHATEGYKLSCNLLIWSKFLRYCFNKTKFGILFQFKLLTLETNGVTISELGPDPFRSTSTSFIMNLYYMGIFEEIDVASIAIADESDDFQKSLRFNFKILFGKSSSEQGHQTASFGKYLFGGG